MFALLRGTDKGVGANGCAPPDRVRVRIEQDVLIAGVFKMAVAEVDIAPEAVDGATAIAENISNDRVVVVVERQERDAPLAVREEQVVEHHLRTGQLLVVPHTDAAFREIGETAILITNASLVVVFTVVIDADRRPACPVEAQAKPHRATEAVAVNHPTACRSIPHDPRAHAVSIDRAALNFGEGECVGDAISSRRKIKDTRSLRV